MAKVRRRLADADSGASFELEWEWDGRERFRASCHELRTFLATMDVRVRAGAPRAAPRRKARQDGFRWEDEEAALAASLAEANGEHEGIAADLLRRSSRDVHKADPSDIALLREAIAELRRVWAGSTPSGPWEVHTDAHGVGGLLLCTDFLDAREVEALRTVYGAHRAWCTGEAAPWPFEPAAAASPSHPAAASPSHPAAASPSHPAAASQTTCHDGSAARLPLTPLPPAPPPLPPTHRAAPSRRAPPRTHRHLRHRRRWGGLRRAAHRLWTTAATAGRRCAGNRRARVAAGLATRRDALDGRRALPPRLLLCGALGGHAARHAPAHEDRHAPAPRAALGSTGALAGRRRFRGLVRAPQ